MLRMRALAVILIFLTILSALIQSEIFSGAAANMTSTNDAILPKWDLAGQIYLAPSSPDRSLTIPSQPPSSWWTTDFDLFDQRKQIDYDLIIQMLGITRTKALAILFPHFLADRVFGTKYLDELDDVIGFFGSRGFRILLFFGSPDRDTKGNWLDPVLNPSVRQELLDNINRTLYYNDVRTFVSDATLYWMAANTAAVRTPEQILAYNRDIKSVVNGAGDKFYLHVDGTWWDLDLNQNGYTPESISPKNNASDGLFAESWAQGTLSAGLSKIIPDYFEPSQVWMVTDVPDGDLNPGRLINPTGSVESDLDFWFKVIAAHGIRSWFVWAYNDAGKGQTPQYGSIYSDARLTLKGQLTKQVASQSLPIYRAEFVITTESDWTRVFFSQADILNVKLNVELGASAPGLSYAWDSISFPTSIGIGKEQFDATKVVLRANVALSVANGNTSLVLTVSKGDLGYTRIEVYNANSAQKALIGNFTNSTTGQGLNIASFFVPSGAITVDGPVSVPRPSAPKMVWAFYYPWYYSNGWASRELIDHPSIGSYNSYDRNVIEKHIAMAKSSGIDGFISSWWGKGTYTDDNLPTILELARQHDFKVTIYLESLAPTPTGGVPRTLEDLETMLVDFLSKYGQGQAIYKIDAAPVVFVWAASSHTPAEWEEVFTKVRQAGYEAKYITDTPSDPNHLANINLLGVFDALHNYGTVGIRDLETTYRRISIIARTSGLLSDSQRVPLWAPSISPGYDERAFQNRAGLVQTRLDGKYLLETYRASLASDPDWIVVTTWNEFYENTQIEPSVKYGYKYLDLIAMLASNFKGTALAPSIEISKTTGSQQLYVNDTLEVRVKIHNSGNGTAIDLKSAESVSNSFFPLNASLGKQIDRLFAGETITYTLLYRLIQQGKLTLPVTNASFGDIYGNNLKASSSVNLVEVSLKVMTTTTTTSSVTTTALATITSSKSSSSAISPTQVKTSSNTSTIVSFETTLSSSPTQGITLAPNIITVGLGFTATVLAALFALLKRRRA